MGENNTYGGRRLKAIFDYLEGKLKGRDRNAFERELERDPFEAEAAEGFAKVSREEAEEDLRMLSKKIQRRTRPSRARWYGIAAAVASILVVTTIFIRLSDEGLEKYETSPAMKEVADELHEKPTAVEQEVPQPENRQLLDEPDTHQEQQALVEADQKQVDEQPQINPSGSITAEGNTAGFPKEDTETIEVYSEDEEAQVDIQIAKDIDIGVATEEQEETLQVEAITHQAPVAMAENPANMAAKSSVQENTPQRATQAAKKLEYHDVAFEGDESRNLLSKPIPADGFAAYQAYLDTAIVYPDTLLQVDTIEVMLSFYVDASGRPKNIKPIKTPSEAFTNEAIRVVSEGPDWIPGRRNGVVFNMGTALPVKFIKKVPEN